MITFTNLGNFGRFGNQLFQYCSLYGIAKRNRFDFSVPDNKNCTLTEVFESLKIEKDLSKFRQIKRAFIEPQGFATVFLPEAFNVPDYIDFCGYFQSPKYFIHCETELKEHLQIKTEFLKEAQNFISSSRIDGFIHVRRTDYSKNNGNSHPPVSVDYIKKSIEISEARRFVVISDDVNWCKENLNFSNIVFSPFSEKHFGYDFVLMTQCKSAIIANSSFSWWGAWLGKQKDVIAPKIWFGDEIGVPKKWDEIYCKDWKII